MWTLDTLNQMRSNTTLRSCNTLFCLVIVVVVQTFARNKKPIGPTNQPTPLCNFSLYKKFCVDLKKRRKEEEAEDDGNVVGSEFK